MALSLQKYHMDLLDGYKSHLIGIEPSLSLKLWIRDMFKTDALQNKATTYCGCNEGRVGSGNDTDNKYLPNIFSGLMKICHPMFPYCIKHAYTPFH